MEGLDALKISEEKKRYIVDLLNPMLEETRRQQRQTLQKIEADLKR